RRRERSGRVNQTIRTVETEVAPAALREPLLVLDRRLDCDQLALTTTAIVDGDVGFGVTHLENEHRLLWPRAGAQKLAIGGTRDEDVVETRRLTFGGLCRTVGHSEAACHIGPLAIIRGEEQLVLRCELGAIDCFGTILRGTAPSPRCQRTERY